MTLLTFALSVDASCNLKLKKKSIKAKTYYLDSGSKLSSRTIEKLSTVCKFETSIMSKAESRALKILELKLKLKKLEG